MAVINGGDITEIAYSNPTVGQGFMYPTAGSDGTFNLGGFRNNESPVVDGARRLIVQKNGTPWGGVVEIANDSATSSEFETACLLAQTTDETIFTISLVNGTVYKGSGVVVGDPQLNAQKSTFSLNLKGGGDLVKQ